MNTFFSVLGSAAGNLALTLGARGGVYLAGGIAPRYIDLLRKSDFRARFLAKGRFADFNGEIATFVVTHPDPGLLGAAMICLEEGGRWTLGLYSPNSLVPLIPVSSDRPVS